MIPPLLDDSIVTSSLLALMCVSLTFTYITTKVPNFAQGIFVTIGIYVAFSLYEFYGISPYDSAIIAFVVTGLISLGEYSLILRPLMKRGTPLGLLILGVLALYVASTGLFGIYTDILLYSYKIFNAKNFYIAKSDFLLFGEHAVVIIPTLALVSIAIILYALLTWTTYGVGMRAAVENPSLARTLGINVESVYSVSWFVAGGLAGVAGSLFVLWFPGGPNAGNDYLIAMFSGSILGGISSIFGAVAGAIIISFIQIMGTSYLSNVLGSWIFQYEAAIPLFILGATLAVLPQGLTSLNRRFLARRR